MRARRTACPDGRSRQQQTTSSTRLTPYDANRCRPPPPRASPDVPAPGPSRASSPSFDLKIFWAGQRGLAGTYAATVTVRNGSKLTSASPHRSARIHHHRKLDVVDSAKDNATLPTSLQVWLRQDEIFGAHRTRAIWSPRGSTPLRQRRRSATRWRFRRPPPTVNGATTSSMQSIAGGKSPAGDSSAAASSTCMERAITYVSAGSGGSRVYARPRCEPLAAERVGAQAVTCVSMCGLWFACRPTPPRLPARGRPPWDAEDRASASLSGADGVRRIHQALAISSSSAMAPAEEVARRAAGDAATVPGGSSSPAQLLAQALADARGGRRAHRRRGRARWRR